MSKENEVIITRPNIFPECASCHIVDEQIKKDLERKTPDCFHSLRVRSISISCCVENQIVDLRVDSTYEIEFVEGGKPTIVPGGTHEPFIPYQVECPHFEKIDI